MRAEIKTDRMGFLVSRAPEPKYDGDGRQRADRESGELLWTVELVVMDATGAEVIKVTTAGQPKVTQGQYAQVTGLVQTPWSMDGRFGIAYRADTVTPAKQQTGAA